MRFLFLRKCTCKFRSNLKVVSSRIVHGSNQCSRIEFGRNHRLPVLARRVYHLTAASGMIWRTRIIRSSGIAGLRRGAERSACAKREIKLQFCVLYAGEKSFELYFNKEHLPSGFHRQINNKLAKRPLLYKISKSNIVVMLYWTTRTYMHRRRRRRRQNND